MEKKIKEILKSEIIDAEHKGSFQFMLILLIQERYLLV